MSETVKELAAYLVRLDLKDGDVILFDESRIDAQTIAAVPTEDFPVIAVFIPVKPRSGFTVADSVALVRKEDA